MSLASKILLSISKPAWQMSCSGFVPSDVQNFKSDLRQQLKTAIRFIKRYFYMVLRRQVSLERDCIQESAKRILWINLTAPSLGDALMDTAGRCLMAGRSITLLTRSHNVGLFQSDPFFDHVFKVEDDEWKILRENVFDLVVLDSYSPRSVSLKAKLAPSTPFVGLYGYLNGYEVHRIIYSFRRLECLLGIRNLNTPKLIPGWPLRNSERGRARKLKVAVAVGGEWSFRTYKHWVDVIRGLASDSIEMILLGSQNGGDDAKLIEDEAGRLVTNLVGKTSLPELFKLLDDCDLFLGADGGLWHIASACGLPSVCLHADCHLYDETGGWWSRAGEEPGCVALSAERTVNEIDPLLITRVASDLIATLKN